MSNGGSSASSLLIFLLPVALIAFMVFSQRRRQRETQNLQAGLSVGDEVCTTSGLFGRITSLDDTVVTLEVSPGVTVRFDRRAIGTRTTAPSTDGTPSTEGTSSTDAPSTTD
ncbi:preprotein translocase subunit YajC [Phycicoccus sp. M110.8]|uniref:preprotein translocase subunit YajC n=1 Tax=Phycicoccus sp. M110.8 TaxID=3075433 RepID=UPI0028FD80BD|nr:preprotein translocase subunit YajC [Phycicoccus sp. M110.8]MDU0315498.1 preprotein translocase subunit YajC [Phycicoccus sp. M110.8]